MYYGLFTKTATNFKEIIKDYDNNIPVKELDECFLIKTEYNEDITNIYLILTEEYYEKISTITISETYKIEDNISNYIKSLNNKLVSIEDYLWYIITHSHKSTNLDTLEKLVKELEYDDLYLLHKYIESGCNASKTAKEMYIHRNTMDYKLNKWSDLLSLNIKSFKASTVISYIIYKNELIK